MEADVVTSIVASVEVVAVVALVVLLVVLEVSSSFWTTSLRQSHFGITIIPD